MTNYEKEIYDKMKQQNGYKMVGYDNLSKYRKDIRSVDKELNIPYVEYSTLKCHEYDGEVIDGKGIIYYFPHYVIRSKSRFNIEPGCGFIDITGFTSYHYGDDATVVIKESEMKGMYVKGFRLFICDLINNNIHFLNASKIGYEEDYRKYAAYKLLVNLVDFNNNHKSMIWENNPYIVGQSSCVIALNHHGYWCFSVINFCNSYDAMMYDNKRLFDNTVHSKNGIISNAITVPLDKSGPVIIDKEHLMNKKAEISEDVKNMNHNDSIITGRYGGKSIVDILGCDMTEVKPSAIEPILSTTTIENRVGDPIAFVTKYETEACARKLAERQKHDANAPSPRYNISTKMKNEILSRISKNFRDKCEPLLTGKKARAEFKIMWLAENVYKYRVNIVEDLFNNVLNNKELKGYDLEHDPCITHWYLYLDALVVIYNISKLCIDNGFGSNKYYHLLDSYVEFLRKNYDLLIKHINVPYKYTSIFELDEFELADGIPKMTNIIL